jgi:hypothetical protein
VIDLRRYGSRNVEGQATITLKALQDRERVAEGGPEKEQDKR